MDPIDRLAPYQTFSGEAGPDPRESGPEVVAQGLERIIRVEGPMLAKRAYDIYLRGCGIKRMGGELKADLNAALALAITNDRIKGEDESRCGEIHRSVVRVTGSAPVQPRERGPRTFEEIPLSELQAIARLVNKREHHVKGSEEHLRGVLKQLDLVRATNQVQALFAEALAGEFPCVDDLLRQVPLR